MQATQISLKSKKSSLFSMLIWMSIIILSLVFSSNTGEYVKSGIALCANTVIPSVFPFMVISSAIISLGTGRELGRIFSLPVKIVFGTSSAAACPIFLGAVCGYPVGAVTAASMYDKGELTKKEAGRLLTFINLPGAAFVINAVGENMLGSRKMGVAVYVSVLLSAVVAGSVGRLFYGKSPEIKQGASSPAPFMPVSGAITEAIWRAAKNMLNVCACVITFSAVSGAVFALPFFKASPQWLKAVLAGILEVSSGCMAASKATGITACLLSASICSWSGLSVHMQIISACSGRDIPLLPFFISKAAQAVLSPLFLYIYLHFFG